MLLSCVFVYAFSTWRAFPSERTLSLSPQGVRGGDCHKTSMTIRDVKCGSTKACDYDYWIVNGLGLRRTIAREEDANGSERCLCFMFANDKLVKI